MFSQSKINISQELWAIHIIHMRGKEFIFHLLSSNFLKSICWTQVTLAKVQEQQAFLLCYTRLSPWTDDEFQIYNSVAQSAVCLPHQVVPVPFSLHWSRHNKLGPLKSKLHSDFAKSRLIQRHVA